MAMFDRGLEFVWYGIVNSIRAVWYRVCLPVVVVWLWLL